MCFIKTVNIYICCSVGLGIASDKVGWLVAVMWSDLDRSETQKNCSWSWVLHTVVLVLVLCCVEKHGFVTLVVIMILKDTVTFQLLFIVPLFCAWNITTVEINSGVHLLKS